MTQESGKLSLVSPPAVSSGFRRRRAFRIRFGSLAPMRRKVEQKVRTGVSKLDSVPAKLAGKALEKVRAEGRQKVREIACTLSPDLSKGARHYVIAKLLGMDPPRTGARRVRSIWHGNAGASILLDFGDRFEAWRTLVARRDAKNEIGLKALAERLDRVEEALARKPSGNSDLAG